MQHNLLKYAELLLFLLLALTYINAPQERRVFEALRVWLIGLGWSYRSLSWLIGWLSFLLSAAADNLTTALVMCAIVLAVGRGNPKFMAPPASRSWWPPTPAARCRPLATSPR